MFWFDLCFPKAAEAVNPKMTGWRSSELIGYGICDSIFFYYCWLSFFLSSCTIEKIPKRVALEAATRKEFKIKEFALLIRWNVSRSIWSWRLLTASAAFRKQKLKQNIILTRTLHFITFLLIYSLWGFH